MISLNFLFWNFITLFAYIYIEAFYSIVFVSIYKNLKLFTNNLSKKLVYSLFKNEFFFICNQLIFLYILLLKLDTLNTNVLSFILVYVLISIFFRNYSKENLMFLNFNIIFFLHFFIYLNTYVTFFLFIEVYSIIFYFFFLYNNKNIKLLQYKNMLLMYLFNNFFVTVLFLIGMNFILEFYGSLNFVELSYLHTSNNLSWKLYVIVISFIVKLALPGFHFLKIEIYKYLSTDIVIIFSVISLFLNYTFIIFFFNHNIIFSVISEYKILNILILLYFFFFIQKLKLNNLQEFISYSGFSTNGLILLNFLI